ncbi:MAG: DUF1016 domain-containing protein [Alphaproteobacteria bacterium GM202ARS2]|nr:DUF1016 domain-containing protein [Alphaproteobacteria bacterium GM202ARS2]
MSQDLTATKDYRQLVADLKSRVQAAQTKAAVSVNRELLLLYWDLGRLITERQVASGWGDGVIKQIATDLSREFPNLKGFSRSNLYNIKQWYKFYLGQSESVQQAVGQIPWGHNVAIIQRVKDPETAFWYVRKTIENGWSRNVLGIQIETQLYERQAGARKIENFDRHLPASQSDLARETLKDPYVFDFLDLGDEAQEREIERKLVEHITQFMLELGKGFAFVGKQYHLEVGDEDFYIDLLFYHLKLHCYVAIELKNGPFRPEYAGKLNFYLKALDECVKSAEDNPSIGLILCKDKNRVIAEWALSDIGKPMGVAEYQLVQALPDDLKSDLPTIDDLEQGLSDN